MLLASGQSLWPAPAAPSYESFRAQTGFPAFRKIDLNVYRSSGLEASGAVREVALTKSGSFIGQEHSPAIYAAARRSAALRSTDGSAPRIAATTAQQGITDDQTPIATG